MACGVAQHSQIRACHCPAVSHITATFRACHWPRPLRPPLRRRRSSKTHARASPRRGAAPHPAPFEVAPSPAVAAPPFIINYKYAGLWRVQEETCGQRAMATVPRLSRNTLRPSLLSIAVTSHRCSPVSHLTRRSSTRRSSCHTRACGVFRATRAMF